VWPSKSWTHSPPSIGSKVKDDYLQELIGRKPLVLLKR
jgi:hypothetical protein